MSFVYIGAYFSCHLPSYTRQGVRFECHHAGCKRFEKVPVVTSDPFCGSCGNKHQEVPWGFTETQTLFDIFHVDERSPQELPFRLVQFPQSLDVLIPVKDGILYDTGAHFPSMSELDDNTDRDTKIRRIQEIHVSRLTILRGLGAAALQTHYGVVLFEEFEQ